MRDATISFVLWRINRLEYLDLDHISPDIKRSQLASLLFGTVCPRVLSFRFYLELSDPTTAPTKPRSSVTISLRTLTCLHISTSVQIDKTLNALVVQAIHSSTSIRKTIQTSFAISEDHSNHDGYRKRDRSSLCCHLLFTSHLKHSSRRCQKPQPPQQTRQRLHQSLGQLAGSRPLETRL